MKQLTARTRYGILLVTTAIVLLLDQLSKSWAVDRLGEPGSRFGFIGPIDFRLTHNSGMAFSRGQGQGLLISIVGIGIISVLAYSVSKLPNKFSVVIAGLVIGGALGNIFDRAFRPSVIGEDKFMGGSVVDFIYTSFWPTFNVADSAVVVGGFLLAIILWRMDDTSDQEASLTVEDEHDSSDENEQGTKLLAHDHS